MHDGAAPRAAGTNERTRAAASASPSRRNITASLDADRSITPPAPKAFPRAQQREARRAENHPEPGETAARNGPNAPGRGVEAVERPAAPPVDVHRPAVRLDDEVPQRPLIRRLRPGNADAV